MIANAAWREALDINQDVEAAQRWRDHQGEQSTSDAMAEPIDKRYIAAFEMWLHPDLWGKSDRVHFDRANDALDRALRADSALAALLEELIPGLRASLAKTPGKRTPKDWVWHHHVDEGRMQFMPANQHKDSRFQKNFRPGNKGGHAGWAVPAGARSRSTRKT
jgi:hypothetical protein